MEYAGGFELDTGKSAAKISNRDELLGLMRRIVNAGSGTITRHDAVAKWREELADHPDYETLIDQIEEYFGLLLFQRCAVPVDNRAAEERSQMLRRKVRETIASHIALSTWVLPGIGKPLIDCTFAEVAEAAPLAGKFLARLSTEGAPGTLVKEVFHNEDALQEFWRAALK